MPDPAPLKPAKVFLALWPDADTRQALAKAGRHLHGHLAGRLTRPDTLHLTLVFIGHLERGRLAELMAMLGEVRAAGFTTVFDRADCWRHNQVAFLAPSAPPGALLELVADLERGLDRLAMAFDRRPYRPHVTLLRHARCETARLERENPAPGRVSGVPEWGTVEPITWSARSFDLVESVATPDGVRYDCLGRFALL